MKEVTLTGLRRMEMREVPPPEIRHDGDVLLKVETVGVCGSDVHYYTTGRIGSQVVEYPFRVGHEFAGTVEKIGPDVTRVKVGDLVAVEPAMSCGKCDQCLSGRRHTCRSLRFLGCPGQAEGCLCEYMVMPQECCYPVPGGMTPEQATVVEPLSIGLYAVRLCSPMQGLRIGIFGCGPIGLSVLLPALVEGADKVYATDRLDARLNAARNAGAAWTGNPDKEDVVSGISAQEPLLLDAVFECCGQQDALDQAIQLLKPGGKLFIIGIPEVDRVSFVIDAIRRREICIQNVRRQNECMAPAISLVASGEINVDSMITHSFALGQTEQAFDLVADYRDGVIKAVIRVGK
jgi:L-iditol 2-dehydrogenase